MRCFLVDSKINFKFDKQSLINIEKFFLDKRVVKIGVLADKIRSEGFGSVELALVHEFGSEKMNIPKRSFFIKTYMNRSKDFQNEINQNSEKILQSIAQGNVDQFFGKVGATWVRYVMETFDAEGPGWDRLSDITLLRRKNFAIVQKENPNASMEQLLRKTRAGSKILQDTGEMKKSITFAIE